MSNLRFDVVGNNDYYITEHLEIGKNNEKARNLVFDKDKVFITLFGYRHKVKLEWLYWLSYYKLNLPNNYERYISDIRFYSLSRDGRTLTDDHIVLFKKPVIIKYGSTVFRLLARFPNYAISKDGTIMNMKTKFFKKPSSNEKNRYLRSNIIDQAGLYSSNTRVTHRLVALAWVPNPNNDFIARPIVDHIDGNKTNCHADNLRWISFLGNSLAAVDQGLNTIAIPVLSKNIDTGEVEKWGSLTRFTEAKGRTRIDTNAAPLYKSKVWKTPNGDYLLKYLSDSTPWANSEDIKNNTNTKLTIIIKDKTFTIHGRNSLKDFAKKEFDIIIHGKQSINKSIKQFLDRYIAKYDNNIKIIIDRPKYQNDLNKILYKAKNLVTGEVLINKTRKELLEYTGIPKSSITKSIANTGLYSYNDWVFTTMYIDFPKEKDVKFVKYNYKIKVTNTKTNKSVIYDSLRKASSELDIPRRKLKAILNNTNNIFSGHIFTMI